MVLIYVFDNILGVNIHTTKKNAETLVVSDKETGLEAKAVELSVWPCHKSSRQVKITTYK
jgi:hypothetical protein